MSRVTPKRLKQAQLEREEAIAKAERAVVDAAMAQWEAMQTSAFAEGEPKAVIAAAARGTLTSAACAALAKLREKP